MNGKIFKHGMVVAAVCVIVGAAYLLGRLQGSSSPVESASQSGADSSTQTSDKPAATSSAHPPLSARNETKRFMRFQVGRQNVKAVFADEAVTWLGTSGGLIEYHRSTGKHVIHNNRNGLLSNGVFHVSKSGDEIWVGTYGGGLSVLDTKTRKWRNYNIPQGLADAFVYDVLRTRSGDIWIATWSGANRIINGKIDDIRSWRLYTVESTNRGLPNDWVYGLAEGKNGEIWMATEGGLARFENEHWTNWNHEKGLGAPYDSVEKDIPFRNDPGDYSAHHARQKEEQGLGSVRVAYNPNYVVSLTVDGQGMVWAGTWGGGLSRFDGKDWKTFTVKDGLPGNHVFALAAGGNGVIWVGTSRGLAKFDGVRFVTFGQEDGLASPAVFSLAMGKGAELWVGSFGGATWFPHGPGGEAATK